MPELQITWMYQCQKFRYYTELIGFCLSNLWTWQTTGVSAAEVKKFCHFACYTECGNTEDPKWWNQYSKPQCRHNKTILWLHRMQYTAKCTKPKANLYPSSTCVQWEWPADQLSGARMYQQSDVKVRIWTTGKTLCKWWPCSGQNNSKYF